ncbi:hypothetical protein BKA70DRAFT_1445098 [Coprinopsis sp. MPI-PUGE-AT-0042]|nr:hypothetical protein BKA70DRAFT_1445098 [Coprinopsis sp. MPI-PUGE-AT-0042]
MSFSRPYYTSLPDEITKEILSPVLQVPDKDFTDTSLFSPFAAYKPTSSTVLEVCKAWLRVATPLLYCTVVLRSHAQAQALCLALRGNPDLGHFIKKIRIEGGYGRPIFEVFKRCPAVNDLWISAALWSDESIAGYANAFRFVDPQRLVVFDDLQETNSKIRVALYKGLGEAVLGVWSRLKTVVMHMDDRMLVRARPLIGGILQGKSKIDSLGLCSSLAEASDVTLDLIAIPTLQTIYYLSSCAKPAFVDLVGNRYDPLDYAMHNNRLIYNKVSYVKSLSADVKELQAPPFDTAPILSSSVANPSWRPFSFPGASKEARSQMLTMIIHHAMSPSELGTASVPTSTGCVTLQAFCSGLTRVSKELREIALAVLYETPVANARNIHALGASPFVSLIKRLWLQNRSCSYLSSTSSGDLAHLISRSSNLVLLSTVNDFPLESFSHEMSSVDPHYTWTDWDVQLCIPTSSLVMLSIHSAGTLQHLHLGVQIESKHPTKDEISAIMKAFVQLRQLRSLVLTSSQTAPPFRQNSKRIHVQLPSAMFSSLERLVVSMNSAVNVCFVEAMAKVRLPSLRWLSMTCALAFHPEASSFLDAHGGKLHSFRSNPALAPLFAYCHNVAQWDCDIYHRRGVFDAKVLCRLKAGVLYALRTLVVTLESFDSQDVTNLLATDLSCLRSLALIHVRGLVWPSTQRDIEKSPWVAPVEALFDKCGIRVTDGSGNPWVPRLKSATNHHRQKR